MELMNPGDLVLVSGVDTDQFPNTPFVGLVLEDMTESYRQNRAKRTWETPMPTGDSYYHCLVRGEIYQIYFTDEYIEMNMISE